MKGARRARFGLPSAIGVVIANMVGVGVLTTVGWMARDLTPRAILLGWAVGGLIALAGAGAYAALARRVPRSGGEYRFLSELMHPAVGCAAGWTSLVVGFAAPVAVSAATAGSFAATLHPGLRPLPVAIAIILLMTVAHGFRLPLSASTQNLLAAAKALLLLAFVVIGVAAGQHALPPPLPEVALRSTLPTFMVAQVYIAYAYTGWNGAAYASEEFAAPARTVPRALLLGTLLVALFYCAVNWVFVANLSPARLAAWTTGDTARITVAHLLVVELGGPRLAAAVSLLVLLSLLAMISSMTLVGPRIYAAMARAGSLPRRFAGRDGRPPTASVLLQGGLALLLLLTHSFELLLKNVGAILTLMSALTVLPLFGLQLGAATEKPGWLAVAAAAVYVTFSTWMLYFVFRDSPLTMLWVAAAAGAGLLGWFASRRGAARASVQ